MGKCTSRHLLCTLDYISCMLDFKASEIKEYCTSFNTRLRLEDYSIIKTECYKLIAILRYETIVSSN